MRLVRVSVRRKKLNALFFDPPAQLEADYASDGGLLIDRSVFDEWGYREGDSVTEEQVERLAADSRCRRAYSRALWLLSARDYTCRGMKEKLARDFGGDAAADAVERLVDRKFLDDARYAGHYAEQLMAERNLSRREARLKLIQKGVPRDLADEAVDAVEVSSDDQLDEWIGRRYASKLADGNPEQIQKVVNALVRKGFAYSDVRAAVLRYCDAELED